jgi:hypothetical protein
VNLREFKIGKEVTAKPKNKQRFSVTVNELPGEPKRVQKRERN